MKTQQIILLLVIALLAKCAYGQADSNSKYVSREKEKQAVVYKHSIGASLLMISNFPEAFADIEEGAPKHIFEPSLNFGFKF